MATGDSLVAAGVPWVTAHDTARNVLAKYHAGNN